MNSLCKNNKNKNKNLKFGVWGEIYGSVEKKTYFEKPAFKNMYCNWNLLTQIDKVL